MSRVIELDAPNVGALEKRFISKAIDDGNVSAFGPIVGMFEGRFGSYVGSRHAVSTQSGTASLHIILKEMGIGAGDEVIVPALTFIASANPVTYVGATPVFADVDANTWNIDPESLTGRISSRTRAVIPVHLYGNPSYMDAINRIASRRGIRVIEDATESLGAFYGNKHTGTIGDYGFFSFNGNKVVTTGGGGMVCGRSGKSLEHIRALANQGRGRNPADNFSEIGYNYRMTNLEAALGMAQLKRLGEFLAKKKLINRIYRDELGGLPGVSFQKEYPGAASSWWFTAVLFDRVGDVEKIQRGLSLRGIPSRRIFKPLTALPPYKKPRALYPNSFDIYERGICLPSSTLNTEADIRKVCMEIKRILRK